MFSLEKLKILTPFQKLPKNVGDSGKLIVAKGFKSGPKSNKLPNLVTLVNSHFGVQSTIRWQPYLCDGIRTSNPIRDRE